MECGLQIFHLVLVRASFVLIMPRLSIQLFLNHVYNLLVVDCGSLPNPLNGTVDTSSGTVFERIATYRCDTGYNLAGPMTRSCGSGGSWTSNEPVCHHKFSITQNLLSRTVCIAFFHAAVACSSLNDPDNGQVDTSSGTTFGSVATFSCDTGYKLSHQQEVVCGANGMWSPASPSCLSKTFKLTLAIHVYTYYCYNSH